MMAVHGNEIACDHDGCGYVVAFQVLGTGAARPFAKDPMPRPFARREGWRIDDDGDFCPRHAEIWEIREI